MPTEHCNSLKPHNYIKSIRNLALFAVLTLSCYYWASILDINTASRIFIGNIPSLLIISLLFRLKEKEVPILKFLFTFIALFNFGAEIYLALHNIPPENELVMNLKTIYIFTYYLSFIFLFKKLGSGIYTRSLRDWTVGFPVGISSFLILLFCFLESMEQQIEPVFLIFSGFLSYFLILGVNTKLPLNRSWILMIGLFLNFSSVILGTADLKIEYFHFEEVLFSSLQEIGFFFSIYACYEIEGS